MPSVAAIKAVNDASLLSIPQFAHQVRVARIQRECDVELYGPDLPDDNQSRLLAAVDRLAASVEPMIGVMTAAVSLLEQQGHTFETVMNFLKQ